MTRIPRVALVWALIALVLMPGVVACGGDAGCPRNGKLCSNCSGSGDCDIPACPAGQVNFCGNFGLVPADQRCSFCAPPDFQP
jgi:hypothetical protein